MDHIILKGLGLRVRDHKIPKGFVFRVQGLG